MANISAFVLFPENVCPDLQIWAVLMSERFTIRMVKYFAKGISVFLQIYQKAQEPRHEGASYV